MTLYTKNIIRILTYSSLYAFTVFTMFFYMLGQIIGNKINTSSMNVLGTIMMVITFILFLYIIVYSFKSLKNGVTNSLDFIYFFKHSILVVLIPLGIFLIHMLITGIPSGDAGVGYGVTLIIFIPAFLILFGLYKYISYLYNKAKQKFISDYKTEPTNIFSVITKIIITIIITLGVVGIFLNI